MPLISRTPVAAPLTAGVPSGRSREHGDGRMEVPAHGQLMASLYSPEVSTAALTTGYQLESQARACRKPRPKSGDMMSSTATVQMSKRPATVGTKERRVATASGTQSLNGHQEYALQAMTDFFSRRPLVQMRNAFREIGRAHV